MHRRHVPLKLTCTYCHRDFERIGLVIGKYCSVKCGRDAYNQKRRVRTTLRRPTELMCSYCGEVFQRLSYAKLGKYCSKRCIRHAWFERNRDKEIARSKRWREANPEIYKESRRKSNKKNKSKIALRVRDAQLRRDFGFGLEEYKALCAARNGQCDICKEAATLRPDHDHSGIHGLRGMLCDKCNMGVGLFRDNPMHLRRAADYLDGPKSTIEASGSG
jgi:hypothetical protein